MNEANRAIRDENLSHMNDCGLSFSTKNSQKPLMHLQKRRESIKKDLNKQESGSDDNFQEYLISSW